MVYEVKVYEEQLKSDVIGFYKNVLPESGRELDLNGKHKVFQDIQNNYENFWCLFCNNHLIGTVGVKRLNEKNCELKALYLYSDFHGKGLGYTLLEKAVTYAKEMNYEKTEEVSCADFIMINTCCVRENAEEKLFGKLGEYKKIREKI